jgi:hypothetical protein
MTSDEIRALVDTLGNIGAVLANAHPEDKAEVYRQLGTTLTYEPNKRLVRAEAGIRTQTVGLWEVSEGGLEFPEPHACSPMNLGTVAVCHVTTPKFWVTLVPTGSLRGLRVGHALPADRGFSPWNQAPSDQVAARSATRPIARRSSCR